MHGSHCDRLARHLAAIGRRRALLQGAVGLGAGNVGFAMLDPEAPAKRKRRRRHKGKGTGKALCLANGSKCKEKSSACQTGNCLTAPFSIEAHWTNDNANYDSFLFVPQRSDDNPLPAPFIRSFECNPDNSSCGLDIYPFACVSQDALGPGDEVTTVRKLLAGKYEFWLYVVDFSAAGNVTLTLRNAGGEKVRSWSSPANPNDFNIAWHVFDIDGNEGTVKSIDKTQIFNGLPGGAHDPNTNVCAI